MAVTRLAGAVEGMPLLLLRVEGAALALGSVYLFHRIGGNWWWFALILVPDISLLAYFFGTRPGAIAYNATHITLVPLAARSARLPAALVRSHRDRAGLGRRISASIARSASG